MRLKGYVSVRIPVPVSVQNIVLRDYCARNGHTLSLSDVEFVFGGHHMLEGMSSYIDNFDGICAYSMWIFPESEERRDMCNIAFEGKEIHFALEGYVLPRDRETVEVLWKLRKCGL